MHELAQTWELTASSKRAEPTRAYVPWWLEESS
jgi:hypothetical protein